MMKKYIFGFCGILLAGLFSAHCFAEKPSETRVEHRQERLVISPSLPVYIFEFNFDEDDRTGLTSDKPILVRRDGNPAVIQILKSSDDRPYEYITGFTLHADIDLNRDGFKDLFFEVGGLGDRSIGGEYFLFNPKTGLFDLQGYYPVLRIEPKTNRIYSEIEVSYRVYYNVINGHLTDTMMVEISEETGDGTFEKTTKVKKHGKWKVIKREFVKNPDWDN
jgi:hypothetical protein